jgi:D-sedoheptulose 7-phosphate isomerase
VITLEYWVQSTIEQLETAFTDSYIQAIDHVIDLLMERFRLGKTLLVCGNGGSAADAQHIAAELVGRFLAVRQGLPAIALATNIATLTAWSNDHEFETVFARQVESLGKPGDILWGISTSGRSKNIILALRAAQQRGITTIGMAGNNGGLLHDHVDYPLFVSQSYTPRVQEIHLITYHRICEQLEARLFVDAKY